MTALAPLAVTVPILVGCVLLALGRWLSLRLVDAIATTTAATVTALDVVLWIAAADGRLITWIGGWTPTDGFGVGIALVVDPVAAGAAATAGLLTVVAFVFSWRYFDSAEAHFHALVLLFLAGMTGFVLSGDLFDMFVFFELMGAVAYALTGFRIEEPSSVQGALTFGIVNSLGAYLTLCGIGLLYARAGELGLAQLGAALAAGPRDLLVIVAFALVSTGFLVKAAVVPFHFWLDDAHAVAPTPVCVLLSGIMVELGLYGVLRTYVVVFSPVLDAAAVQRALLVLGTATAAVGAVMCLLQRHLKRLLAYSTVAHVGTFLVGLSTMDPVAAGGVLVTVVAHAGVKGSLFLMAGIVLNRYGSVDELDLHGRGRGATLLPWLMPLTALALAGLPPFGTALGRTLTDETLTGHGIGWAVAVSVLVSAATGAAVLRSALRIFHGIGSVPLGDSADVTTGEERAEVGGLLHRVPLTMLVPMGVLVLGGLAVGTVPGVADAAASDGAQLLDRSGYVGQVLSGASPAVVSLPDVGWTWSGAALGLASTGAAVLLALLMLHRDAVVGGAVGRSIAAPGRAALRSMRALHSGHIGDYVAWLFAGVALFAALLMLPG